MKISSSVVKIGVGATSGLFAIALAISYIPMAQARKDREPSQVASKVEIKPMMNEQELRQKLSQEQYHVAVEGGTEPPFHNAYWDNKQAGLYVDIISGKPLFSSHTQFSSGTGWPSFYQPLDSHEVVEKKDRSHGMVRTEIRSKTGQAHLGHVFPDGPPPTGLRYCINSASLRFIPAEDLEKEGYGDYQKLFQKNATQDLD